MAEHLRELKAMLVVIVRQKFEEDLMRYYDSTWPTPGQALPHMQAHRQGSSMTDKPEFLAAKTICSREVIVGS